MNKTVRFTVTAVISFAIYLLLAGSVAAPELLFGIVVGITAASVTGRFLPIRIGVLSPVRIVKAIAYAPYFLWKMLEANVRLALIIINPSLPIKPSLVKGTTALKSDVGKLLLTSSITLTPGTLSVDVEGDDVYVHCVVAGEGEKLHADQTIMAPFEKRLTGVTE